MPRAASQTLLQLLRTGAHYDTLQLGLTSGVVKRFSHADLSAYLGSSWLAGFGQVKYVSLQAEEETDECGVGATAFALGTEVDRVEVAIQNVDEAIGADIVSAARRLAFATAKTGKFLFDPVNPSVWRHPILFDGIVSATNTTERTGKISIISDRVEAGDAIATKTLSPRHGWTGNDMALPYPPSSGGGGAGGIEPPTPVCLTGETLILTTGGDVPIKELVERFQAGRWHWQWRVFCFDPKTHRIYQAEVKQVFRHVVPRTRILRYEFAHGSLNVTPEHNIATVTGKLAAGSLTAETKVLALSERRVSLIPSGVKSFAWEAGNDLVEVFNFEAAVWHTYFANRTAVYNRKDDIGLLLS